MKKYFSEREKPDDTELRCEEKENQKQNKQKRKTKTKPKQTNVKTAAE